MFKKIRFLILANYQLLVQYRGDIFIYTLSSLILPLILVNVWVTVAQASNAGISEQRYIVTYFMVQMIVNIVVSAWHDYFFGGKVRDGTLSQYLLKPFPFILHDFSSNIAEKLLKITLAVPPILFAWFIWKDFIVAPSTQNIALFIPVLLLGALINFLVVQVLALTAFWTANNVAISAFNDMLFYVTSGKLFPLKYLTAIVPLWFVNLFPYRYIVGFPIDIYLGSLPTTQIVTGVLSQVVWIFLLVCVVNFMWQRGLRTYNSYGG